MDRGRDGPIAVKFCLSRRLNGNQLDIARCRGRQLSCAIGSLLQVGTRVCAVALIFVSVMEMPMQALRMRVPVVRHRSMRVRSGQPGSQQDTN